MILLNYGAAAGLTALVGCLLIVGSPILLPLVIAVSVWYLINALATLTRGIKIRGRRLPSNVRFGGALVVLLGLGWLLAALIIGNVNQVVAAAPIYEQNLQKLLGRISNWMGLEQALSPIGTAQLQSKDHVALS